MKALRTLVDANDRRYAERFLAQEQAVSAALAAAKEAVTKAEIAADKRFDAVNEFRQTLSDQAATFVTRAEVEQRQRADAEKLDELKSRLDRLEGRSRGLHSGWLFLIGAISTMATIIFTFLALAK